MNVLEHVENEFSATISEERDLYAVLEAKKSELDHLRHIRSTLYSVEADAVKDIMQRIFNLQDEIRDVNKRLALEEYRNYNLKTLDLGFLNWVNSDNTPRFSLYSLDRDTCILGVADDGIIYDVGIDNYNFLRLMNKHLQPLKTKLTETVKQISMSSQFKGYIPLRVKDRISEVYNLLRNENRFLPNRIKFSEDVSHTFFMIQETPSRNWDILDKHVKLDPVPIIDPIIAVYVNKFDLVFLVDRFDTTTAEDYILREFSTNA